MSVVITAGGAAAIEAEGVAATFIIFGAGDLAVSVVAESAFATFVVFFAGAADDAATIMADLRARAFHGVAAVGGAISVDGAEVFFKALFIDLASLSGGAEALVALAAWTFVVGFAGGDICRRDAVAAGGADLLADTILVGGAALGADAEAADAVRAIFIASTSAQALITLAVFIGIDVVAAKTSGAHDEVSQGDEEEVAEGIGEETGLFGP